jgi:hypothetical protein
MDFEITMVIDKALMQDRKVKVLQFNFPIKFFKKTCIFLHTAIYTITHTPHSFWLSWTAVGE